MKIPLLIISLALALTGCKTNTTGNATLGPALFQVAVSTGATAALIKHPEARFELQAAADVICGTVHGKNPSPAQIIEDLNVNVPMKPTTALIASAAINSYSLVYASLASTNGAGPYAIALCGALQSAAAVTSPTALKSRGPTTVAVELDPRFPIPK